MTTSVKVHREIDSWSCFESSDAESELLRWCTSSGATAWTCKHFSPMIFILSVRMCRVSNTLSDSSTSLGGNPGNDFVNAFDLDAQPTSVSSASSYVCRHRNGHAQYRFVISRTPLSVRRRETRDTHCNVNNAHKQVNEGSKKGSPKIHKLERLGDVTQLDPSRSSITFLVLLERKFYFMKYCIWLTMI